MICAFFVSHSSKLPLLLWHSNMLCMFFCVVLQLSKFSSDVHPTGKQQTGRGQLLLPLLLLWCPHLAASQHHRQQCGSHCSPDCNHFNVRILSVWWGIVWRVSILANHCRLSVFNNNHIKLWQLAHSYKYTERDVEGEEEIRVSEPFQCQLLFLHGKLKRGLCVRQLLALKDIKIHCVFLIIAVWESLN